jgi:hypothetical protein
VDPDSDPDPQHCVKVRVSGFQKQIVLEIIYLHMMQGVRGGGDGRRAPWTSKYGTPVRTKYRYLLQKFCTFLFKSVTAIEL